MILLMNIAFNSNNALICLQILGIDEWAIMLVSIKVFTDIQR